MSGSHLNALMCDHTWANEDAQNEMLPAEGASLSALLVCDCG